MPGEGRSISALHFDLSDQFQPRASGVHQLDPRLKVILTVAFILAVTLTPDGSWGSLAGFLGLVLLTNRLSNLGWTFSIRRGFIALPFALAAFALPFTIPGPPAFTLPILGWTATVAGLIRFASILIRMWVAVQVAILLTATTRFPDLLWALAALRVPLTLIWIIGFMYRYLFVLADEALRMLRARAARSASSNMRARPSFIWRGRVTGSMIGALFLRSIERSERVYAAMLARGYDGRPRPLKVFHMRPLDWAVLSVTTVVLGATLTAAYA